MKKDEVKQKTSKESQKLALHYMDTLIAVARESFLILDSKLRVIEGNPTFYNDFQVTSSETENVLLYELGNGQWDIPELKKLLEEILPEKKEVRDYEVTHNFESIGKKTIVLNAKQIDSVQLIILAMEDVTLRQELETKVAGYTKGLEDQVSKKTAELQVRVEELEKINKVMVGREIKMTELKAEVENLKNPAK